MRYQVSKLHVNFEELSRQFEARCAGQKAVLGPGDTVTVPAGALHGMTALEQGVLLDIFTPIREDFLK